MALDPTLRGEWLTSAEYFAEIEWENPPYALSGWGFRVDLNGNSNLPVIPQDEEYRWARIDCPVCRRPYLGWFVANHFMRKYEDCQYALYDSSFFYAYNDEPSARDRENVREVSALKIGAALDALERTQHLASDRR